jgi:hypothetical protein
MNEKILQYESKRNRTIRVSILLGLAVFFFLSALVGGRIIFGSQYLYCQQTYENDIGRLFSCVDAIPDGFLEWGYWIALVLMISAVLVYSGRLSKFERRILQSMRSEPEQPSPASNVHSSGQLKAANALEDELRKLDDMKQRNIITEDEHKKLRNNLIERS